MLIFLASSHRHYRTAPDARPISRSFAPAARRRQRAGTTPRRSPDDGLVRWARRADDEALAATRRSEQPAVMPPRG